MPLSKRMMGYSKKSVQQAMSLGNLNDVSISSVSDNEIITYDSGTGKWINTPEAGGGGPGGSTTYMQYNNAGSFGGISTFTFDGSDINLTSGDFNIVPTVGTSTLKITGSLEVSGTGGDDIILRNDDDTNPKTVFIQNDLDNATISFLPSGGGAPTYVTTSGNFWGVGPSHTWGTGEHLTFDLANTRLGIGTDSPTTKLEVLATTEQLRLSYNGSNYTSFIVDSSANLDIDSGGIIYLDAGNASGDTFFQIAGTSYGRIGSQSGNDMIIACVTQDKDIIFKGNHNGVVITPFVIDFGASGNVGIGTTSPVAKLEVSGAIALSSGSITSSPGYKSIWASGSNLYWGTTQIDAGGGSTSPGGSDTYVQFNDGGSFGGSADFVWDGTNVGIGIEIPTATLDVAGDFSLGSSVTLIENGTIGTISGTAFQYGVEESTYTYSVHGGFTAAVITTSANYYIVKPVTPGALPSAIPVTLPDGSTEVGMKITISQPVDADPEQALAVAAQGGDVVYEGASNSASGSVAIASYRGANKTFLTIAAGVWVVIE